MSENKYDVYVIPGVVGICSLIFLICIGNLISSCTDSEEKNVSPTLEVKPIIPAIPEAPGYFQSANYYGPSLSDEDEIKEYSKLYVDLSFDQKKDDIKTLYQDAYKLDGNKVSGLLSTCSESEKKQLVKYYNTLKHTDEVNAANAEKERIAAEKAEYNRNMKALEEYGKELDRRDAACKHSTAINAICNSFCNGSSSSLSSVMRSYYNRNHCDFDPNEYLTCTCFN